MDGPEFVAPSRVRKIVAEVSSETRIPVKLIVAKLRLKPVVLARWKAMSLIHSELKCSYTTVARYFSTDHSTVIKGIRKHLDREKEESKRADYISVLRKVLSKIQVVDREEIVIGPTSWGFIHLKLSSDHWAAADEWAGEVTSALEATYT